MDNNIKLIIIIKIMVNIMIYLYDNMTHYDNLSNDIMTLLNTKQINTFNYKQNYSFDG